MRQVEGVGVFLAPANADARYGPKTDDGWQDDNCDGRHRPGVAQLARYTSVTM
jgi:hypothetical protein